MIRVPIAMPGMSSEARKLEIDLRNGCTVTNYKNAAPRIVMPRPGGPIPLTKGQVSDRAAREVTVVRIARAIHRYRAPL